MPDNESIENDSQDAITQAYVKQVYAVQAQRQAALTDGDLAAIASELGLGEADLAAAQEAAQKHYQRGVGFIKAKNWDEAIAEFERSCALRPTHVPTLAAIAESHERRFNASHNPSDRDAAEKYARRCLEHDPQHGPSFKLLSRLVSASDLKADGEWKKLGWGALVTAMLGALGAGLWMREAPPPPDVSSAPSVTDAETTTPVEPPPKNPAEVTLPLTFEKGTRSEGLVLDSRLSELKNYPERSFYSVVAIVENQSQSEIRRMQPELRLYDAAGKQIDAQAMDELNVQDTPLRPGDRHLLSALRQTTPKAHSARIALLTRDDTPAPSHYGPSKPVPLVWDIEKPKHLKVAANLRFHSAQYNSFSKQTFVRTVLELVNEGEGAIGELRLRYDCLDDKDTLLDSKERLAFFGPGQALMPGEKRLVRWVATVKPSFHHDRVHVLAIE